MFLSFAHPVAHRTCDDVRTMTSATRRLLVLLVVSLGTGGVVVTSSGCSSTSSAPANGCDVSLSNVNAAGATILATPFHDDASNALFWNPMLKHLDVLGGDVGDKPARAFELELFGQPIVDGATITLGLADPANPLTPTPRLSFTSAGTDKMRSSAGTVHFTTASSTRLVFTVDGATMVTLDQSGQPVTGGPSVTVTMKCAIDAKAD
jgi:hypothetical protein